MADRSFDSLRYSSSLEKAGVPKEQANVMAEALGIFVDNLVSREYLDMRLGALEARLDARMDAMEARLEARLDARMDSRLAVQEARFEARLEEKLSPVYARLVRLEVMGAAIFVAVVIPLVRDLLA